MISRQKYKIFNGPVPVPFIPHTDIKPYNILTNEDEDSVEINMYGEVVQDVPTDWWTGERIDGLFIVLADFLNDMDSIKTKSNVTFHINSPGGDAFAGVSIMNRMKEFTGTVTTQVDGLAASAASIIAQGATPGHRKVCTGSLIMIHGAASFLYGSYNAIDMKERLKQINAVDKSIADIYAKYTGVDVEKVKSMMSATTWMSAQEAIEKGFADEVVENGSVTMCMSDTGNIMMVNGIPMSVKGFANIPAGIPIGMVTNVVTPGNVPVVIETNNQTGGKEKMTLEELMKSDPELVTQIQNAAAETEQAGIQTAVSNALAEETARMQAIDEIAGKIGNEELVNQAKYGEKKMTAADLALEALKAQSDAGQMFLKESKKDGKASGVDGVEPAPNGNQTEAEQAKEDINAGANLIAGVAK